jgi:predicted transporter
MMRIPGGKLFSLVYLIIFILMGIFYEMTIKKGYAGYLVSETRIFLGIVYMITGVIFWRIQLKN